MNYKTLTSNVLTAFAAQGVSMLVSATMSLLVPKVMGVESYGYWQLFVFYVSYSGLFLLGLNDGIYLIEGGKKRSEIDKRAINSQITFGICFQILVGLGIIVTTMIWAPEAERFFIICAFAAYTVVFNASGLFGYLFQAINETKLFSFSTMLERLLFLIPMLALVFARTSDFRPYVIAYFAARCVSLVYCCWHARDILNSGRLVLPESVRLSFDSIRVGFSLMVAGVADLLILGVARGLIDHAWGIQAFGEVSFSLSLVNFFMAFVSQAAMVLFPALRQGTHSERKAIYKKLKNVSGVLFPAVYILYAPSVLLLALWLPQYATSMHYLAILLPICVFNTKMSISCTTYFKVLREEKILLRANFVTMFVSAVLSCVGVYLLESLDAVLLGVVACLVGRSLWCERYLDKKMGVFSGSLALQEVFLTIIFVSASVLLDPIPSLLVYACAYGIYLFMNRDIALDLLAMVKRVAGK